MIERLKKAGITVAHAWGMTETSPIGTIANLPPEILKLSYDDQMKYRLKQGVPPLGVELKLKDEAGAELPHDGATFGRLMVKGPTISRAYFKEDGSILDDEGFFVRSPGMARTNPHIVGRPALMIGMAGEDQ